MKLLDNEHCLYLDNHVAVFKKPHGIPTQPDFVEEVAGRLQRMCCKEGRPFLHPIHRLDRLVGGLVVFARTSKALSRLNEGMRQGLFHKTYRGWVAQLPHHLKNTLVHYLAHKAFRAVVDPKGKKSVLDYQVLGTYKKHHLLEFCLHTGRYHQIRAQMSLIGCPIMGDYKYRSREEWLPGRTAIALYHTNISFPHPISKNRITISVIPSAFKLEEDGLGSPLVDIRHETGLD